MSFLSNLLTGVGVAAAPFTGGASLALTGLGAAGGVLGGMAKGAAAERAAQNASASNNYQTRQQALLQSLIAQGRDRSSDYATRQGATTAAQQGQQNALVNQSTEGLQRARLGLDSASQRARQSVLGSLMQNAQPSQVAVPEGQRGHVTRVTGALNPSMLDPMTRAHGAALMKAALEAQLSGSDVPAATNFAGAANDWRNSILDVPEAVDYSKGLILPPEYQKAGRGESWMSGLGAALGLAGAVGGAFGDDDPRYREMRGMRG